MRRMTVQGMAGLFLLVVPIAAATGEPGIHVEQRTIDLGRVRQGEAVAVVFDIENRGDEDIVVQSVRTSCSCTVSRELTEDERRIEPGETLSLGVTFDSRGRKGQQKRDITVNTNDPIEPRLKLFLEADVVPLLEVIVNGEPTREWRLGNVRVGAAIDGRIEIFPTEPQTSLEVEKIELLHPALIYERSTVVRDTREGIAITLAVIESAPLGTISAGVEMKGKIGEKDVWTRVQLRGLVVGELIVMPTMIEQVQPVAPGNRLVPIIIRSGTNRSFRVLSADAGPAFETTVEKKREGLEYRINLQFRESAEPGPVGTYLDVRTDVVQQPLVRVPIFAHVFGHIKANPAMLTLRNDSDSGRTVRVKLETARGGPLQIVSMSSDLAYITARIAAAQGRERRSVKFIEISLASDPSQGEHEGTLFVKTTLAEQPVVEIPVLVLVR